MFAAPSSLVASSSDLAVATWPAREALRARFRCDRRCQPRWSVAGTATLLALGTDMGVLAELSKLDGSPWWLGGDATTAIPPGTRVSVGFSDPDGRPATATVERCEGMGQGRWRVAVRFDGGAFLSA